MRLSLSLLVLALTACESAIVNDTIPDAAPPPPDATPPNYLGQACGGALPACPLGWDCLTQVGGNGSWCTKSCLAQDDPSCNAGYIGVGWGACILTPPGQAGRVCTIVCRDPAGPPNICPPEEDCTGSCPTPLQCISNITDANMVVVGQSCS